jgi:2-hydroxychromene-2-carboxylate isomerase
MSTVTWYFDFISPYSYLALHTLQRLPANIHLSYQPVLLAGLLNHWGQKGPAEIPPKRVWTYRSCIWLAQQRGVPFHMPAAHPFNSLPYLRLSIAAGNSPAAIHTIFNALWTTRVDAGDPSVLARLAESMGLSLERLAETKVKDALREATTLAAQRGIFGVPSLAIDEQVFWGSDAIDFATAYLIDPDILATEEIKRADALPIGASRAPSG